MQNIEQILTEFGITLPADKKTEIMKKIADNYKTIAEHEKAVGKLETERDNYKAQAENAAETLKSFDGIDPAKIQSELADWKKKAEDAEKNARDQIYERDFSDALKEATSEIKFSSEAAKKSVMAEIKEAGLKMKDGKILGLNDLIESIRKNDASAFVNEEQQQLEQNKGRFTTQINQQNNAGGKVTREEILKIKDHGERQRMIAQNIALFKPQ